MTNCDDVVTSPPPIHTHACTPAIQQCRYLRTGATLGPSRFEAGVEESGAPVSTTLLPSGPLDGVWAQGFWNWDWMDTFVPVVNATLNATTNRVVINLDDSPPVSPTEGARYVDTHTVINNMT